jgi:hypothetical protein
MGEGNFVDLPVTNTSNSKIDGNENVNMNNNVVHADVSNNAVGIGTGLPSEKIVEGLLVLT